MADYILEAGGTMAFTFHVLFMLFNLFIIYQFYFNDKFFNELGFSNEEPKLVFRGPLGAVFLTMLLMSILLTFDVTGNTYDENVVQYKFYKNNYDVIEKAIFTLLSMWYRSIIALWYLLHVFVYNLRDSKVKII